MATSVEQMEDFKTDTNSTVVDESDVKKIEEEEEKENTKDEEVKENKNDEVKKVDEVKEMDEEINKNDEGSESDTTDKKEEPVQKSTENKETVAPDTQWGGKRKRKSVEQFKSFSVETVTKELEVGTGRGVALGDIPFVHEMLAQHTCEQLKPLHKILFNNTVGTKTGIKIRIRKFNGYSFTSDDTKPFNSVRGRITKMKAIERKEILKVLGMNVSSKVDELLDFLMEPQDKGKKVVSKKTPKKPAKSKTSKRKSSSSKSNTPVSKKRKVSQIYSDSDGDDLSDDTDAEEEEESEEVKDKEKKSKPLKVPSNKELRRKVKDVVGALDLDTISMKQAVSKIFECYPDVDLSEKKQFIKDQIRELLG